MYKKAKVVQESRVPYSQLTSRLFFLLFVLACVVWMSGVLMRIEIGRVALVPFDVCVGLVALYHMRIKAHWKALIANDPLVRAGRIWVACAGLSTLVAFQRMPVMDVLVSALYLVRVITYIALALIPIRTLGYVRALRAVAVVGVGFVSLGWVQYFLYPDLRNMFYAGWDEHMYRMFGSLLDPNFMGAVLVLLLGLYVRFYKEILPTALLTRRKLLYTLGTMSIVIMSVSVVLTYSRGSYVMLLVFALATAVMYRKWKSILGILVGAIIILTLLSTQRQSEGVTLFRTASIQARLVEYKQAVDIIREFPILGTGYNTYRYVAHERGFVDEDTWQSDHAGAGVPNSYLFMLATTGVLGGLAGIYLCYVTVRELWQRHEKVILALFMGLGAHALTENSFVYPHIMFICALILAFIRSPKAPRPVMKSLRQ